MRVMELGYPTVSVLGSYCVWASGCKGVGKSRWRVVRVHVRFTVALMMHHSRAVGVVMEICCTPLGAVMASFLKLHACYVYRLSRGKPRRRSCKYYRCIVGSMRDSGLRLYLKL